VRRWREQVKRGGSDKVQHYNFDWVISARANKQHAAAWKLQLWVMAASFQFTVPFFPFKASSGWVKDLKNNYKISLAICTFTDKLQS
jgi:hypothetical protein